MFVTCKSAVVLLVCGASVVLAAGPPPALKDPFLDNFVAEWSVARKMGNGRTIGSNVQGEWVLNQFIQLHYGASGKAPEYEALVLIGYDDATRMYVCHWVDVYGGHYSGIGRGRLDPNLLSVEFEFDSKEGLLTNKFAFDPETKSWTSLIRQEENRQWKTFAEEKWTRK